MLFGSQAIYAGGSSCIHDVPSPPSLVKGERGKYIVGFQLHYKEHIALHGHLYKVFTKPAISALGGLFAAEQQYAWATAGYAQSIDLIVLFVPSSWTMKNGEGSSMIWMRRIPKSYLPIIKVTGLQFHHPYIRPRYLSSFSFLKPQISVPDIWIKWWKTGNEYWGEFLFAISTSLDQCYWSWYRWSSDKICL